jgi:acyl phosphate:glycerol-3-phosphate acyltransferase
MLIFVFLFLLLAYLVGSIPTGYLLASIFHNKNITLYGSKNIGATNVARVFKSIKYFFIIFLIDALKAYLILYIVDSAFIAYFPSTHKNMLLLAASCLFFGNVHSVFLGFKGGKGVATTLGIIFYLLPFSLIFLFILSWLMIVSITKQIFIASIGSMFFLVMYYGIFFMHQTNDFLFYFLVVLFYWIVLRHRENLKEFFRSLK